MRLLAAVLAAGLVVGVACAAAQDDGSALRRRVRALAETGRLAEAERVAREAGAPLALPLGDILVLRGHLAAAESAFAVAVRAGGPDRRSAEAGLAELAVRRGDRATARRRAGAVILAYDNGGARWSADERTAAGRAYVILGDEDPQAVRDALRAFDAAVAADSGDVEPRLRLGDLFLSKYNAPEARASYRAALRLAPGSPRALLGLARVLSFEGSPAAFDTVALALAGNPALAGGHALLGRLLLDGELYDSAAAEAGRALVVDSTSTEAWALLGATAWLRGDSARYAAALRAAGADADFHSAIAEAVARHRRYADAVRFGREAVARDSTSAPALGVLGINELRLGDVAAARAHLDRAFARDPFHVWYKNTLDLLDQLTKFRTVSTRRFRIVAPPGEADLLALYLGPLLETAFDSLAARYEYSPPVPVRIELYRSHADFSVRTVGLAGIGALGVSFGSVLAMDAPSARAPGSFNWGSTAWHELTHAFTLGLSAHRVPRWFSEGVSVLEERRARRGWGAGPSVEFLAAYKAGMLPPVSRLNDGFVRPSFPGEIGLVYYQASLVAEMIEGEKGRGGLVGMLRGWRDGLDTRTVFDRVLGLSPPALDAKFDAWIRARFAAPLAAIAAWDGKGPIGGQYADLLRAGAAAATAGRQGEAIALFTRAEQIFPGQVGPDAPALALARLARERGDSRAAVEALARYTALDESAWAPNAEEAELRQALGDTPGMAAALGRMIWISPYDAGLHGRLAAAAEAMHDLSRMVVERRAAVLAGPPDPLEARYQLARALALGGDPAAARREILQVLEGAPGFEKAQALLLELSRRPQEEVRP